MSTMLERRYRRQHLNCVRHITLDPKGRGVVRIHMIPPREDAENAPFLLLLNGSKLVPLNLSWAILLSCFMDRLEPFAGLEITESDWNAMAAGAVARTHKVYPFTPKERLAEDLQIMIESLVPSCGACLSNMAIAPDGGVIPCQSWLSSQPLGNILADDWDKIWQSERCAAIRAKSAKMEQLCQLRESNREEGTLC